MSSATPGPVISSRDNPLVQRLRRLLADPSAYRREGVFLMEGEHLCSAYLQRGHRPELAVFSQSAWEQPHLRALGAGGMAACRLSDRLFGQLSALPSPSGVAFVAACPQNLAPDPRRSAVLLDRVQDPGNVGSILRSASALGVGQVWTTPGTASLWSPKVLRAGMGAHFGLNLSEAVDVMALAGGAARWVATSSHASAMLGEVPLPQPCVWVLGHEGQGVAPEILALCGLTVRIPQPGGEESLNVAAAAAICLYESARTRLR